MQNKVHAGLLAEVWAIEPRRLQALAAQVLTDREYSTEEIKAAQLDADIDQGPGYAVSSGVARIPIKGVMLKEVPWTMRMCGVEATSTTGVRRALAEAVGDSDVNKIVLDIESPGGSLSGLQELADDIYAAREHKTVVAHGSDIMASAAYWIGAQADRLTANKTAEVGSIGVYTVLQDSSEAHAMAGVKVHVISSHELKGAGVVGSEVTKLQLKVEQELIDKAASMFVDAVAFGRGMSTDQVQKSATGRVWFAEDAKARGLIDDIDTIEGALGSESVSDAPEPAQQQAAASGQKVRESPMVDETTVSASGGDEQRELLKRAEKAEALAAASSAQLKEVNVARCAELIDEGITTGRIAPATREHVERMASAYDYDAKELAAAIATFPVVTRAEPLGETVAEVQEDSDSKLSASDARVAKDFGHSDEHFAKMSRISGSTFDGHYVLDDGTIVSREEYLQ